MSPIVMTLANMIVVFELAGGAGNPASVDDVFQYRDTEEEQLYYVAVDERSVIEVEKPRSVVDKLLGKKSEFVQKVHANNQKTLHEVAIYNDADSKRIAQKYIDNGKGLIDVANYENYAKLNKLHTLVVNEATDLLGDYNLQLQIESGENHVAHAFLQVVNGQSEFMLEFYKITDDQTLRIYSGTEDGEYSVRQLYDHWRLLLEQYRDL